MHHLSADEGAGSPSVTDHTNYDPPVCRLRASVAKELEGWIRSGAFISPCRVWHQNICQNHCVSFRSRAVSDVVAVGSALSDPVEPRAYLRQIQSPVKEEEIFFRGT